MAFIEAPGRSASKRQILHLLIPCRLLLSGSFPCDSLLSRYNLSQFYPEALHALRKGDTRSYQEILNAYEHDLLAMGTFLIWERLVLIGYRALVRLVWRLEGGGSRIELEKFRVGLDAEMDIEEVGCLLANLIDTGLIKGYISQERATLVLSQKDPFAPLSQCRLTR